MPVEVTARYISGQEFNRFCLAKGVNAHCERCGHGGWDLHDTDATLGMAGIANGLDGRPTNVQTQLLTLSCINCGTLWSVVRGNVQEWLDANPSTDESHE